MGRPKGSTHPPVGSESPILCREYYGPSVYSQCKGVQGDQYLDAVDAFATDRLPRVVGVHEVSILDLVFDGHVLVEGELAGKRYVDDHTHGPHVQGSVESLLA